MDINVNITFLDKLIASLDNLAAALFGTKSNAEPPVPAMNTAAPQPAPAPVPTQQPAPTYQPSPIQPGAKSIPVNQLPYGIPGGVQAYAEQVNAMVPPSVPATPPAAPVAPTAAPQAFSYDDLARAASSLMDAGKQQQLIGLLQQFQAQSLQQLSKDRYGEFATALRGMGARI